MKWYIRLGQNVGLWWKQWETRMLGYPEDREECPRCGDAVDVYRDNWKTKARQYACQGCHNVFMQPDSSHSPTLSEEGEKK